MAKKINTQVTARECRGNHEKMIRKFMKKVKKNRIIEEIKDRRYYKKPSIVKKEKRIRAAKKRLRDQQKMRRAQERRNRRN